MTKLNIERIRRLIAEIRDALCLDLSGHVVLTEAATGWYGITASIAAAAGAERVLCLAKDTRFGTQAKAASWTATIAESLGVRSKLDILFDKTDVRCREASIVTNLGMVRPIDKIFLNQLNPTAVIPLMWETWEFRPEDLDLQAALSLGIPVLGTDEHHPNLQIFPYVGHLALKLAFEANLEVWRGRFVVLGHGEFAKLATDSLRSAGADVEQIDSSHGNEYSKTLILQAIVSADALIVVDHHHRTQLIDADGWLTAKELSTKNCGLVVIHISGGVNREHLIEGGIRCWPDHFSPAGYMSVATDYLGPRPLIDLHTAGLRVGQEMAQWKRAGKTVEEIMEKLPTAFPLAQGFISVK